MGILSVIERLRVAVAQSIHGRADSVVMPCEIPSAMEPDAPVLRDVTGANSRLPTNQLGACASPATAVTPETPETSETPDMGGDVVSVDLVNVPDTHVGGAGLASRAALFMQLEVPVAESMALAVRLEARDWVWGDDRNVCLECRHLSGTATARRCANYHATGMPGPRVPAELVDVLQHCRGFGPRAGPDWAPQ